MNVLAKKRVININIGQYYASRSSVILRTILGSCVAVCVYDEEKSIGGMNHILLPGDTKLQRFNDSGRFGINAMEQLVNGVIKLGGKHSSLRTKIFGGAHILHYISKKDAIGKKNIRFVINYLEEKNIKIISSDIGGHDIRTVFFHTDTGVVYLKRTRLFK